MIDEPLLTAYRAAHERAAFADISNWGWIRLAGRDRLDLLHRLSTNAVKQLKKGQGAPTVLTSPTGRVMAMLTVYAGEDDVFLRTMPGQAPGVTRYLTSMIFWNDQVEVADLTAGASQFALYGPDAAALLQSLVDRDISGLPPYGWLPADIGGELASVHRAGPLEAFQWFLDVAPSGRAPIFDSLAASAPQLDAKTIDILRIEAGVPFWGRELTEQVTPLEVGLIGAVNFNKGCYTGQEVIARQANYDKVTRNLVGLELPIPADSPLLDMARLGGEQPGASEVAQVRGPGRGGFVSSIAYSPALGKVIALAVVPRDLAQAGTEVDVVAGEDSFKATVRGLPFIPTA